MRNRIALFIVFIICFTSSYSQTKFGATLGLNTSRFTDGFKTVNGSYFNFSSTGLSIGAFAEFEISEKIKFYPKIIYNQIADREKDFGNVDERGLDISTIDYKLDYLSIPLNFRFFSKPYLTVGPQIGILLSEKAESLDLGDVKTSVDFGGNFGIGYPIQDFRIELTFYQGFSTLLEIEREFNDDIDTRNTYVNFSVGYIIK
ncbi:outer membrane beta-barrel protein [Winogradskyella alexanderae]|uniref:PorT family protein n=1 Tax=Winogradskyella alexanderae TaxID=2877123 RepID=A0ABS7XWH8_9FLAO|nr:outer membrane beta-barrel protein [Winogradskyella alexanderae]MCA0133763.1 PorT family protein [Winogradskyella alexanderae]